MAVFVVALAGIGLFAAFHRPVANEAPSGSPSVSSSAPAPTATAISRKGIRRHLVLLVDNAATAARLADRFSADRSTAAYAQSTDVSVEFIPITSQEELEALLLGLGEARYALWMNIGEITLIDIRGE